MPSMRIVMAAMLALPAIGVAAPARAAPSAPVELSNGSKVAQGVKLAKLNLTNAQREAVRKGVMAQNSDVEFRLKSTKKAKDFVPVIGAKLPTGVKPDGLPSAVLAKVPQLRDYGYVTMKDQVLLVNAMAMKIVDVFPETQPVM